MTKRYWGRGGEPAREEIMEVLKEELCRKSGIPRGRNEDRTSYQAW